MNRRRTLTLGAMAAVVAMVGITAIWWPRSPAQRSAGIGVATAPRTGEEKEIVTLYFPGPGRNLQEEEREIDSSLLPEEKARRIVQELIAGPRKEGLYAPLPSEVEVQGTYVGKDDVVYVDLHRPESGPPPAAGSLQEMLMVYCLVNSIVVNVDGIGRVALLWNGNQPLSLSGHIDNGKPLAAKLGLVAASS